MTDPSDGARWARLEEICVSALDVPVADRAAWLERACDGDEDLLSEARSLIASHDPDFLEAPLVDVRSLPDALSGGDVPTDAAGGVQVPGYRIVRPLGRGGMGDVYLATRVGEDYERYLALKVLRRGLDTDDVVARFRQERRILSSLRHPNIAVLVDGGRTEDGRPFFAMEYVEGVDLARYVGEAAPTISRRIELVVEIARAVAAAHRALVIHRDLKPGNVMVASDGRVRLLDFGIAKVLDERPDETSPRTRAGLRLLTPEYAAPEQLRGDPVTTATDVWALGIILYELVTGQLPWGRDLQPSDLENAVLHRDAPAPGRVLRGTAASRSVGGDLDVIVLKAIEKEPGRRYASATALADDLVRYLEGRPILARPGTWRYRAGKFVRRRPWVAATGFAGLVALLATSAVPWVAARRAEVEREKATEVQAFLLEMFGATGGDRSTGDTLTARGLLDRQAALVGASYSSDPDMHARMSRVLAEAYDRLGLIDPAEFHAREALRLEEAHGGLSPDGLAASRNLMGWIHHQRGDHEQAASLLESAIELRRSGGPRRASELARSLNDLGVVRDAQGDFDAAATLHQEAFELRRRIEGEESMAAAVSASNLAVSHYRSGDYEQSTTFARLARDGLRASLGPDHQRSIIAQNNLAAIRIAGGDLTGARDEYEDLLARQTRLQGRSHPVTSGLMSSLAVVHVLLGDGEPGERLMREARTIETQRAEPLPERVAETIHLLGRAIVTQGRFDEGIAVLDTARMARISALGEGHREVAATTAAIAEAYSASGAIEEAADWQRRALGEYEAAFGADHPQTTIQRERLREMEMALSR